MRRPDLTGAGVASVLAAGTLIAALTTTLALGWPRSAVGDLIGLSHVHEARADALLRMSPVSLDARAAAARETELSLRESVANPTAWLRLAYLDSLRNPGLSDAGRRYLARSYAVAPYGPDDTPWRLRFAFDHWRTIGAPLRSQVLREVELTARGHSASLAGVTDDVSDPSGRLAAELAIRHGRSPDAGPAPLRRRDSVSFAPLETMTGR